VAAVSAPAQAKVTSSTQPWDSEEVPSPVPEENQNQTTTNPQVKRGQKTRTNPQAAPVTVPSGRRTKSRSTTSSKKRRLSTASSKNDAPIEKFDKEEEEGTDPNDENYMDFKVELNDDEPGPSSRKRKRGNTKGTTKSKATSKMSTKVGKPLDAAPVDREARRLRSFASASSSRTAAGPATRVFALWKQDGHFYSGTVHSLQSGTKYLIKFDDDTEDEVDILRLRLNGLRKGDSVILAATNVTAIVVDDTRLVSNEIIGVEFYNGQGLLEPVDVETSGIRIAARTIYSKWGDRVLTPEAIVTTVRQKLLKREPSPSKVSISSTVSDKDCRRKSLLRTGIAITLTPKYDSQQGDRETLTSIIKNSGGTVIDDWFSVIRMDGDYSRTNKQWVAHAKDVRWVGRPSIQRIFLLADDFNAKPKYLTALALGIPCLSLDWLHDLAQSVNFLFDNR
jgi:hypothetical protein